MSVSYNKLFKLLIDKKMKKKDLCELAGISSSTVSKMGRGETVSTDIIAKICIKLNCSFDDIMELNPDVKTSE